MWLSRLGPCAVLLAQLVTVVLFIKEIKLVSFGLHGVSASVGFYGLKMVIKRELSSETHRPAVVLRNDGYSRQAISKKLKAYKKKQSTSFTEQRKPTLTRMEREVRGPGAQLCRRIKTSLNISKLRHRRLTGFGY